MIPFQKIPRKRNSTLDIPAKRRFRTHEFSSSGPKYSTARNVSLSTPEIASTPNESFVNHELNNVPQSELSISTTSNLQVPIKSTSATSSLRPVWYNFTPIRTIWLRFGRAILGEKEWIEGCIDGLIWWLPIMVLIEEALIFACLISGLKLLSSVECTQL